MNLIVMGSHSECEREISEAVEFFSFANLVLADFLAVGMDSVLKTTSYLKYMATFHPCDIVEAKRRRRHVGLNYDFKVISHIKEEILKDKKMVYEVDIIEPYTACREHTSGSSALLGVKVALKLGYDKIILCGCPLIGISGTNYNYKEFHSGWIAAKDLVMGKVKAMSGWTREFLGYPTKEWANGT